jgi:putative ABC transport system permease protein
MIRNYIRIAWRNLVRRKAYTTINITGLAIGIAACLLLFTVVSYEKSYDRFLPGHDRIFRVVTQDKYPDDMGYNEGIPFPALDAIRLDFPQLTTGVLYANYNSQVTVLGKNSENLFSDKKFIEGSGIFYADPQFFSVFQYQWLAGTPAVLAEPNNTVLSRQMAEKYFGNWKDAVGQYLKLDNSITSRVAGIIETPPANTDFPFAVVTSFESFKKQPGIYGYTTDWGTTTSNFQIYVLLPGGVNPSVVNQQFESFSKKYYNKKGSSIRSNFLQPLSDIHFDTRFNNLGDHITSKATLWTLSLIGIFIIIMACINFINLSTAQAVSRSKEVGVRKVLGSNRVQLFWQVLGETGIIVLISMALAFAIAWICMPYIKHIASIQEPINLFSWRSSAFALVITVVVTILSGFYPSFVVSRFNPSLALKNKITSATVGGISLRRGLVILQFAISQILIIGTIVAVSQMNFVQRADLGFNKEAILVLNSNADSVIVGRQLSFKQQLLQIPGIQSVSFSSDVPSSDNNWASNFAYDHRPDEDFSIFMKLGDEDYINTYGLQLAAGRWYEKSDTMNEVVVNETLLRKLNVKDPATAIGKEIRTGRTPWRTIVGVVKDFKSNSLRQDLQPLVLGERRKYYSTTGIKLKTNNLSRIQAEVRDAWNKVNPEYAYTSAFMDENINNFYRQEQQLSLLYKIFAGVAIFISCLGLYGLVSFMAVQRTKEVGIRKVLGASAAHIIYLFSKEFTLLIIIAFVIAVPVAYYLMNGWLNNFVFRVNMGPGVFLLAIAASIILAWLTVGYKSIKSALSNPVKNLRSE